MEVVVQQSGSETGAKRETATEDRLEARAEGDVHARPVADPKERSVTRAGSDSKAKDKPMMPEAVLREREARIEQLELALERKTTDVEILLEAMKKAKDANLISSEAYAATMAQLDPDN